MTLSACFRMADSRCVIAYELNKEIKIIGITNITDEKYSFPIWLTKELTDQIAELIENVSQKN